MSYRTIFLEPDWLHIRYLGWTDAWPDPCLRVMTRRDGPVIRHLLVSDLPGARAEELSAWIVTDSSAFAEITVHDLDGSPEVEAALFATGFVELQEERMLNRHTLVIDLARDEGALLAEMNADTRRKLRLSEREGVSIRFDCGSDPAERNRFLGAFNAMASERDLSRMPAGELDSLLADGHSRLAGAFAAEGDAACYVLTYEAGKTALFHQGASDGAPDPLLGRALHWALIRQLKQEGLRWYDFGGLPTIDPANGITRFKLGFGGEVVDLGREYRLSGIVPRLARQAKRMLGR